MGLGGAVGGAGGALEGAAGEGWRCEGGSRAEIVGAVRAAAALESWACAAKLGLIRAAIREDDLTGSPASSATGTCPTSGRGR